MKTIFTFAAIVLFAVNSISYADMLVSDRNNHAIHRYDNDGNFIETFISGGQLQYPRNFVFGPDGNFVYVQRGSTDILKYAFPSGDYLGSFLVGGDIVSITDFLFGPNGDLFVLDFYRDIKQFDGSTGQYLATAYESTTSFAKMRLEPHSGDLFLSDSWAVDRFAVNYGVNGIVEGLQEIYTIDPSGSSYIGGFDFGPGFGPEGDLYLLHDTGNLIKTYDLASGDFVQNFSFNVPLSSILKFRPDGDFNVQYNTALFKYSGVTGELLSTVDGLPSNFQFEFIPIPEPTTTIVVPSFVDVTRGEYSSGTQADLALSDDHDLSAIRGSGDIQSRVFLELSATSVTDMPTSLTFTIEAAVFARSTVTQSVDLFNYDTGSFEEVHSQAASRFIDVSTVISPSGDVARFVEPGTSNIEARIRFESANPRQRFSANVDQAVWTIGQ